MNSPYVRPEQIPLDLLERPAPSLANFVPGANAPALAALREALAGRGPQFIHLWGPPGSGRSHLLESLVIAGAAGGGTSPVPPYTRAQRLYVADDVQALDAAGQAALFALQNEVRSATGACLVTAADQPPVHLALREDVRTRLGWGLVFGLQPIAEAGQAEALAAYARARGARVDEDLVPYMLTHLPRDMRSLVSVLDALDTLALARHRALTVPLLREWLRQSAP